jgi:hypothetical protein
MSGFDSDLLTGMAVWLAAQGSLSATWNTTGVYTSAQTGIVLGDLISEPDKLIALDSYGVGDDPAMSDSLIALQVKCRGAGQDPRSAKDIDAAIFTLLHAKCGLTLSTGVLIVQSLRNSGPASLGQDANKRWTVVSNYYLSVHRPSANRT